MPNYFLSEKPASVVLALLLLASVLAVVEGGQSIPRIAATEHTKTNQQAIVRPRQVYPHITEEHSAHKQLASFLWETSSLHDMRVYLPWPLTFKQASSKVSPKTYEKMEQKIRTQRARQLSLNRQTPTPPNPPINCKLQKCIALTFDDGPGPHTARLLDHLQKYQAKATFFLLGLYVERHAPVVKRMVEAGHQVGNHTWHHRDLTTLPPHEVVAEIGSTNHIIQQVSGAVPHVMRPPYGATSQDIINASTMPQILWSVDPLDWYDRDAAIVAERLVSAATPGAILLGHDVYPSTVDAIPLIIERLRAQDYVFVTIDELLGGGKAPPLGEYRHQP